MAKSTDIPKSTLSELENDKYNPSASTLVRLSDYFHVPSSYLLTGESSPISENQQRPYPLDTPGHIPESCLPYSELIKKTCEILESDTYYATALTSNIIAFHNAVKDGETTAERFDKIEHELEQLKVSPRKAKKVG